MKYPDLKYILFSNFKNFLYDKRQGKSQNYHCVVNAIFLFFSKMNFNFLSDKIIKFMVKYFYESLESVDQKIIVMDGIIQCFLNIFHLFIH